MDSIVRKSALWVLCVLVALSCPLGAAQGSTDIPEGSAIVEKPTREYFKSGGCMLTTEGSFVADWMSSRSTLGFIIGPFRIGMFADLPQSRAKYKGPGEYKDVLVKFTQGGLNFMVGLSTVKVNPGGRHGRFDFNDGTASGTWDCGRDTEEDRRPVLR